MISDSYSPECRLDLNLGSRQSSIVSRRVVGDANQASISANTIECSILTGDSGPKLCPIDALQATSAADPTSISTEDLDTDETPILSSHSELNANSTSDQFENCETHATDSAPISAGEGLSIDKGADAGEPTRLYLRMRIQEVTRLGKQSLSEVGAAARESLIAAFRL